MRFSLILLFLFWMLSAFALEVIRPLRPEGNYLSFMGLNACSTQLATPFALACNPASFSTIKEQGIFLTGTGKGHGDSIETGKKLLLNPISEGTLRDLFGKSYYNSFTLSTDVQFLTPYFGLSYSPYYLLADVYIFNPAFPEASVLLANQSTLKLTSGSKMIFENGTIYYGANLAYFERTMAQDNFTLFDLALNRGQNVIHFNSNAGLLLDLGTILVPEWKALPKMSATIKNLGEDRKVENSGLNSGRRLEPRLLFDRYSSLGLGYDVPFSWGKFSTGLELPFYSYFEEPVFDQLAFSSNLDFHLFMLGVGLGKYHHSIGVISSSKNTRIGLIYISEKNLGARQTHDEQAVYLDLGLNL